MTTFKKVKVFSNEIEAEIASGLLADNGIRSTVSKDDAGGMRPHLQLTLGVRLLVASEQFKEATAILASELDSTIENNNSEQAEDSWVCSDCEEKLDGQFTACWSCGSLR